MKEEQKKRKFPVVKFILVTLLLGTVLLVSVSAIFYVLAMYPYNLAFAPKFTYRNDYYEVKITSFVVGLWLHGHVDPHISRAGNQHDVTAYYKVLQCEETYQGDWELETLTKQEVIDPYNSTMSLVYTESTLPTQKVVKYWMFYPDRPYFRVKLVKEYTISGENLNNQIIFDGENTGHHTGDGWFAYETEWGTYGCIILDSDPDFLVVQPPGESGTEFQLNFYNQSDRTRRYHERGEVEWVELLVYADSYGTWSDIKELGGELQR